jgi:uncharacterized protein YjbJ (UPF0337 family)
MNKDRVEGSAKQAKGSLKQAVGKATGSRKMQAKGAADKAEGKVQSAVGGAKDAIRDASKHQNSGCGRGRSNKKARYFGTGPFFISFSVTE